MQWISVKDKFPEIEESVLVYGEDTYKNKHYYVAWIEKFGIENKPCWQYSMCCGCYCCSSAPITHWMPLPNPPEDKQ